MEKDLEFCKKGRCGQDPDKCETICLDYDCEHNPEWVADVPLTEAEEQASRDAWEKTFAGMTPDEKEFRVLYKDIWIRHNGKKLLITKAKKTKKELANAGK